MFLQLAKLLSHICKFSISPADGGLGGTAQPKSKSTHPNYLTCCTTLYMEYVKLSKVRPSKSGEFDSVLNLLEAVAVVPEVVLGVH